jgi:hypothetical protein
VSHTQVKQTSPFVVGRPLRADEPIFGREEAFRFIATELAAFSSVNIIGERRMGKTSLLHHLIGNQSKHLISQPNEASLVLAHIDLQRELINASHFYGVVLQKFLTQIPSKIVRPRNLAHLIKRLNKKAEAPYDEFEQAIRELRNLNGTGVRPVIVIDEFEYLIGSSAKEGFPYPGFFNGLRSIIGDKDGLLAMIIASRRPLAEHFSDPARPDGLTSTFPNYFQPFTLEALDDAAADELLLQKSDHALNNREVEEAKQWARGHVCHLQVAGASLYQAKASERSSEWAYTRREELKGQSCMVGGSVTSAPVIVEHRQRGLLKRLLHYLKIIFWNLPVKFGRLVQLMGAKINDMAAWVIGALFVIFLMLLALRVVSPQDFGNLLKKIFGMSGTAN